MQPLFKIWIKVDCYAQCVPELLSHIREGVFEQGLHAEVHSTD